MNDVATSMGISVEGVFEWLQQLRLEVWLSLVPVSY